MKRWLLISLVSLLLVPAFAQPSPEGRHELTIYFIPSAVPYDWSSPHSLYRSYVRNHARKVLQKNCYILGHAFIELHSPVVQGTLMAGMRSCSQDEQTDLVLKEHYGLAILGTDLLGRIETTGDLEMVKEKYSKKGKLAFVRIFITEEQAEHLVEFYETFKLRIDSMGSPGRCYGGAFWPRYYGEGSGCSAFVVSILDISGILRPAFEEWMIDINIPMDLIGGPFNNFNQVKLKEIKKCRAWAGEDQVAHVDYEPFRIYDPSLMYQWVMDMHDKKESLQDLEVSPVMLNKSKGVEIDARSFPVPVNESIFQPRAEQSIFIDVFLGKFADSY